jgi:hypothetical protein
MNPDVSMRGMLAVLILCACLVGLTELWWFAFALLALLATWWGVLNAGYGRKLGARPRRVDRASKDLEVAIQMAIALGLPAAVTAAAAATGLRITTSFQFCDRLGVCARVLLGDIRVGSRGLVLHSSPARRRRAGTALRHVS